MSNAGPGLEGLSFRDWSTDEAYSERPSGEGKLLLPASLSHPVCAVPASLRATEYACIAWPLTVA